MLNMALILTLDVFLIMGIVFLLTRTEFFEDILDNAPTLKSQSILILVLGAISVFATYSGVEIGGAIANVRDLAPMIGGLIGGPVVGLGAGLIGGIHRYFLGGFTAFPCSTATILAGLFGGIIYYLNRKRFIGIFGAVVFAALMEAFHMELILLTAEPYEHAVALVDQISIPMMLLNAFGMLIFALLFARHWKSNGEN
jgi:sigma-B regulation protein RsbU (phosphoserine phosphatase)